jgi:quercetin dioxygenase-like cupin family protein
MKVSRRQLAALVPALAAAQSKKEVKEKAVLPTKCFVYEDLTVRKSANGNEQRALFNGLTHGRFPVEAHITSLAAGEMPHAAHRHIHEEMVLLRTGKLDVTVEGKTTRLTPGSVAYVYSNEEHGWKNPGPERAEYFVIALGQES